MVLIYCLVSIAEPGFGGSCVNIRSRDFLDGRKFYVTCALAPVLQIRVNITRTGQYCSRLRVVRILKSINLNDIVLTLKQLFVVFPYLK